MNLRGIFPLGLTIYFAVVGHCLSGQQLTKRVISPVHVREADVMWAKRVWRIIDTREKLNQTLFYPLSPTSANRSLWDIVRFHLENEPGSLTAYYNVNPANIYEQNGDQFLYPLKFEGNDSLYRIKLKDLLYIAGEEATTPYQRFTPEGDVIDSIQYDQNGKPVLDEFGNVVKVYPEQIFDPITSSSIIQWEVKEDWFFDKQRSVMDVRIIGICPHVYSIEKSTGKIMGSRPLFWIYFPELKYIIQNYAAYNPKNDAMRMSYLDLFLKRKFSSFIKKESNEFDRSINEYTSGIEALYESERIKNEFLVFEHDLWDY